VELSRTAATQKRRKTTIQILCRTDMAYRVIMVRRGAGRADFDCLWDRSASRSATLRHTATIIRLIDLSCNLLEAAAADHDLTMRKATFLRFIYCIHLLYREDGCR